MDLTSTAETENAASITATAVDKVTLATVKKKSCDSIQPKEKNITQESNISQHLLSKATWTKHMINYYCTTRTHNRQFNQRITQCLYVYLYKLHLFKLQTWVRWGCEHFKNLTILSLFFYRLHFSLKHVITKILLFKKVNIEFCSKTSQHF